MFGLLDQATLGIVYVCIYLEMAANNRRSGMGKLYCTMIMTMREPDTTA